MGSLGAGLLVLIFIAAAVAIWVAGMRLAHATDALDQRLGIGSAFGGLILLAFVTNLPEIAFTASAALQDNLGLAVGNLVGGVAIQTVVLSVLDAGSGRSRPLTFLAASLLLVLEAATVILVVVVALMGTRLPASTNLGGASPASVAIVGLWIAGLLVVRRAQRGLEWRVEMPDAEPGRTRQAMREGKGPAAMPRHPTARVVTIF